MDAPLPCQLLDHHHEAPVRTVVGRGELPCLKSPESVSNRVMPSGWRAAFAGIVLAVATISAQDLPNFSGEWVLIDPSIDPAPVLTVVQNEQRLEIEALSSGGPSSGSYGVGTVGGVIGPIPGGEVPRIEWSWKDGTLVVTFEGGRLIPGLVRQEVWSLDLGDRLVVTITTRKPNAAPDTTRFVYRKSR